MKQKLERLIRLLHKRRFAEKIATAKNAKQAKRIYNREFKRISKEVISFSKSAREILNDDYWYVVDQSFTVRTKDAVELGLISFMTGIKENDLLENWSELKTALDNVCGEKAKTAREMLHILKYDFLSNYTLEELLGIIFI